MERVYETLLSDHLNNLRQMVFLSGPRQVGKTTTSCSCAGSHYYYNWDRQSDRMTITTGSESVAKEVDLSTDDSPPELRTPPLATTRNFAKFLQKTQNILCV